MKKTIYLIFIFLFIQGVIHNIGHPVTPAFVRSLEIPDYMFGVFFAMMALGLMIGGPIWGILSDYGKRKLYIILGLVIYGIGQLLFAYSNNMYLMVLYRFIAGFGVVSTITIMISQIIEFSDLNKRAKNLAYAAALQTLGASLGYFLGGILGTSGFFQTFFNTSDYRNVFLIQVILNTIYILLILITFKDHQTTSIKQNKVKFSESVKEIFKMDKSLLIFMFSLTFMTIGSINVSKYLDVYFDELNYTPQQLGTFVMTTGFVSLFASIFLVPIFAKVKKQLLLISVIHILSAIILFYVFRSENFLFFVYTIFMFYVIFKTIYIPLEQNYIALEVKNSKYGKMMGVRLSFLSFGMVVGPLIGGFLYDKSPILLFDFSSYMFIFGVFLLFVVYILKKKKTNT
jgi:DHA1 family multidrug resistance protein-like MFS transporter